MIHDLLVRYKDWCEDSRWSESMETVFLYIVIPAFVCLGYLLIVFSCVMVVVATGQGL